MGIMGNGNERIEMEIGLRKWDEGNGDRRLRMEDLGLRK